MSRTKNTLQLIVLVIIFLTISITLGSISSETLLGYIGSDNAFILIFILGIIGGLTTFTGIPYHLVLMSLAAGGINPIGLGICTALGVMLGDSTMFLLSKKAKTVLSANVINKITNVTNYINRHPKLLNPFLILYGTLSPFSNDFIVASLGIMGYRYRQIIIPLTIGNIFYNIAIAYLGYYTYDVIINLF